jgi:hypothetical protein
MDRQAFGALLIVVAIFLIWAYNTGRLSAIFDAIVHGQKPPPEELLGGGAGGAGRLPGSNLMTRPITAQSDWKDVVACYARASAGDYSCIPNIWTSINSPSDVVNLVKNVQRSLFGWTGIKL